MGKISIQDLVYQVIKDGKCTQEEADLFVQQFFTIIEEFLEIDGTVKIKGFGTFKLIDVESRESINVNTGERIEIKKHSKVSFVPEASVKELINKPFSHFKTTPLNEDVSVEEIEQVTTETLTETVGPTNKEYDEGQGKAEVPENSISDVKSEADEISEVNDVIPDIPNDAVVDLGSDSHVAMTDDELKSRGEQNDKEISSSGIETREEPDLSSISETSVGQVPESITSVGAEDTADVEQVTEDNHENEINIEENKDEQIGGVSPLAEREECDKKQKSGSIHWLRWITLVLGALVLAVSSYFIGYRRGIVDAKYEIQIHSIKHQKQVKEAVKADEPKETTPAEKINIKAVQSEPADVHSELKPGSTSSFVKGGQRIKEESAQVKLSPRQKYRVTGTRKTIYLHAGQSLLRIAKKEYGHNSFVKYIISYNNIKDPDLVEIGTKINLPEMEPAP